VPHCLLLPELCYRRRRNDCPCGQRFRLRFPDLVGLVNAAFVLCGTSGGEQPPSGPFRLGLPVPARVPGAGQEEAGVLAVQGGDTTSRPLMVAKARRVVLSMP
jgi:hypothetical protein